MVLLYTQSKENKYLDLMFGCYNDTHVLRRLQHENMELRAKVAELQSALASDHRRVAALESRLKNAERSRDEAQKRNEELQRDIQQFPISRPQAPT